MIKLEKLDVVWTIVKIFCCRKINAINMNFDTKDILYALNISLRDQSTIFNSISFFKCKFLLLNT